MNDPKKPKNSNGNNGDGDFHTTFRHWRTGELMDARNYGYKSWPPFGRKKRKPKK